MRAIESFSVVHDNATAADTSGNIRGVDGATMGKLQIVDNSTGTYTVRVQERVHASAAWVDMHTLSASGVTELRIFGNKDIQIDITAIAGGAQISVYLGLNS